MSNCLLAITYNKLWNSYMILGNIPSHWGVKKLQICSNSTTKQMLIKNAVEGEDPVFAIPTTPMFIRTNSSMLVLEFTASYSN